MSFDKAIEHKKEHRRPYHGGKAVCKSCRNHGSYKRCESNRKHKYRKIEVAMEYREKESKNGLRKESAL